MTATAIEPSSRSPAVPTAWLALACLGATVVLGWLAVSQPQRAWPGPELAPVELGGQHYRVVPEQLAWIEAFSRLHFAEGREAARAHLQVELATGLDAAFGEVRARLPAFADWYYSLGGEYSRLSMAALARLNLAEDGYVGRRAAELLFPETEWTAALRALERQAVGALLAEHQATRDSWLATLGDRLAPHRVPSPLAAGGASDKPSLQIDTLRSSLLAREQAALETRVALSTFAAGGAAAATVWRGAVARSGQAAAARGIGRGAARAGSAATGGLAACAPTGPYALGCAAVAGAVAWLATDWVLLRVDEAIHRETLLAALEAGLAEIQAALEAEMLAVFDAAADRYQRGVDEEITRTFQPLRAGVEDGA